VHAVQVPQSSLVEDSKLLERMLRQVHNRKSVVQHATRNMQHAAERALLERMVRQASALCCAAARQAHATCTLPELCDHMCFVCTVAIGAAAMARREMAP
jgi:hypothetical protein